MWGELACKLTVNKLVVALFTEIKTSYRGFEMKLNPVFLMLVLSIENIIRGRT